ncbi:CcdB family protein [Rhodoplanes sp. TEM]|uniref:Toxin CcdB n=1 Tax=Rhodoplanes tepidamans TaxID=200616 RepID=A0ABT5J7L2_RHOTP|nr:MULTISPECIES: CcdB family protein [Rhodoplanes]MDC7785622.1 CcdB family protein [Rhodoplanes tepidamans]MDC7985723.1 CcdB family protein [Rhodoplanes sp. TEM]MDQ0354812.1 toxin CcdB [Rhodoplanes tepidamans]
MVQSDLLGGLNTTIVVPLIPADEAPLPAGRLNPVFDLSGRRHVMMTQFLAAVPIAILKRRIETLAGRADEITGALDMLFHGF